MRSRVNYNKQRTFKQGELYVTDSGTVVMCTETSSGFEFPAVCLHTTTGHWSPGEYYPVAQMDSFKPFKGTLELISE
jgi:hypothetical protein